MSLESFRRGAQSIISSAKKSGGGKKGGYRKIWRAPQLPAGETKPVAEPIVAMDAEYSDPYNPELKSPMFRTRKHTFKSGYSFKTITCSAGFDPHSPNYCIGCYEVDHGRKGSEAREIAAVNIAHLKMYHEISLLNRETGAVIMRDDRPNEPVKVWEECEVTATSRNCKYCAQQTPTKFGEHRILELGSGHLQSLLQMSGKISNNCANCGTTAVTVGYACGACSKELLNLSSCGYSNDQITQFSQAPTQCPGCTNVSLPVEIAACGFDPQGMTRLPGKGCQPGQTVRLSLFDVVLYLQREGSGKDTKLVELGFLPIKDFPTPDQKPLSEHLKEIVKRPFNFGDMYSPKSLQEQADILGVPNPYAQQNQQQNQQYSAYGAQVPNVPVMPGNSTEAVRISR